MPDETKYDGLILPSLYPGIRDSGFESILGITQRELYHGPDDLKINIAQPTNKGIERNYLVWFENTPESGSYSNRACCYWTLPSFTKLPEMGGIAIRVRPSEKINFDETNLKYDYLFWSNGKPVNLGHEYETSLKLARAFNSEKNLSHIVESWIKGNIDLNFSMSIGELRTKFESILGQTPGFKLNAPIKELEMTSRDASWEAKSPLVTAVV